MRTFHKNNSGKFGKSFWTSALLMLFCLFLTTCDNVVSNNTDPDAGNNARLTVKNIPAGVQYAAAVYDHSDPITDLLEWANIMPNAIAWGGGTGTVSYSTLILMDAAANAPTIFSGTGSFMVVLNTTSAPITTLYKTGVNFNNGYAEIDYNDLVILTGGGPGQEDTGKLTINNFPGGASFAVTVYNSNEKVSCQTDITDILTQAAEKTLAVSLGLAASSPVSLQSYSNPLSAFDNTGTFLVLLVNSNVVPMATYYADQTDFTYGSATIDFTVLGKLNDLPLTKGGDDDDDDIIASAEDFGPSAIVSRIFSVSNAADWDSAVAAINSGGNSKNYVINVKQDFSMQGISGDTFTPTDIKVSIRGDKAISLSGNGSFLGISTGQTVIVRDLKFIGLKNGAGGSNNNRPLVSVSGSFTMRGSSSISANVNSNNNGGGIALYEGSFAMENNAVVSDNGSRSGGGVFIASGFFTMQDNSCVSGNSAYDNGSGSAYLNIPAN